MYRYKHVRFLIVCILEHWVCQPLEKDIPFLKMSESAETKDDVKDDGEKTEPQKRKKLRGKALHKIKEQMEFYFSHANLRRDRFMGNLVKSNPGGHVKTEVFLTFNQIRKLTDDPNDIVKAISHSNILEVTSDGKNIRAKRQDSDQDKNYDDCIIYVERLPEYCDYKYVKNVFSRFGHINYVSLPRFRNSSKIKGFSFVEFDNPDSCKEACNAYKTSRDNKGSATNEHQLKFNESKKKSADSSLVKKEDGQKPSRKRKQSENEKSPEKHQRQKSASIPTEEEERVESGETSNLNKGSCKKNKRRKRQSSESEVVEKKKKRVRLTSESGIDKSKDHEEDEKCVPQDGAAIRATKELLCEGSRNSEKDDEIPAKRIKLEHSDDGTVKPEGEKNKDTINQENEASKDQAEATDQLQDGSQNEKKKGRKKRGENDKLELRVISKTEWKQYKNRYLSMQKKAMSSLKKMLLVHKKQQAECEAMLSKDKEQAMEMPVEEPKAVKVPTEKIEFQPGVIVKLSLMKSPKVPSLDLIKTIKAKTNAAFVDVIEDNEEAFVRFLDKDVAKEALEANALDEFGSAGLVTGTEETEYWKKLEQDRETHFNRGRTNKRGRDKIIAKATALAKQKSTHIHFDEQL